MSTPVSVNRAGDRLPLARRTEALIVVAVARALARIPPRRLQQLLATARTGAQPASLEQALSARHAVVSVSTFCAGNGCLPRSLAAALLCRLHGTWPTWCTGVRTAPFSAHAWIEVDGRAVGEPAGTERFHRMIVVPPAGDPTP